MHKELFNEFPLTEGEELLLKHAETPQTAQISHARVLSDLYTIKKNEKFVKELIASNEKLSGSNSKYALALNILTGALVLVSIVQIIVNFLVAK
jgi:hypothetical protein